MISFLEVGAVILIAGSRYQVIDESRVGPDNPIIRVDGQVHYIQPFTVLSSFPAVESKPRHRNDRAYLKRKKGRS